MRNPGHFESRPREQAVDRSELIDRHVGRRVKMRRKAVLMSQAALGAAIGVTFQQIQKYEKGSNRISASKLYEISQAVGVDVGYFFAGVEKIGGAKAPNDAEPLGEAEAVVDPDLAALVRSFARISNPSVRRRVAALVDELGRGADGAT